MLIKHNTGRLLFGEPSSRVKYCGAISTGRLMCKRFYGERLCCHNVKLGVTFVIYEAVIKPDL